VEASASFIDTSPRTVRFVIALKTNGPLRFDLLHAIEAGL